jgi:hypothetical protein
MEIQKEKMVKTYGEQSMSIKGRYFKGARGEELNWNNLIDEIVL